MQAVGILGGTFDPIHFGHLRMAQELCEQLSLGEVRFIPSARPPHREVPRSVVEHRANMVQHAIADNPLFVFDDREIRRDGPSYMVDTLASLRQELGEDVPLFLLLGADAFLGLDRWHRWLTLFDLTHIAVACRPGVALDPGIMSPELKAQWQLRHSPHTGENPAGKILQCEITALDISSSAIRAGFAAGHTPRYLLPESVLGYIFEHQLYMSGTE
ncbi:nicotinate-nucleotide adenylyltransferase [Novimethylophilus kurashikiensis]|uniref:Probable nicotinate-nucleotide adenylyltransferase n=1 Tax=Novimethylophilus kurashikiensis TaxID=1825523 RepID=A0A2R5F820_9PROT|nr:nicotinate-nucleotide adenylyltransferase [Novimethylophilus kurashikiensis]GBG14185.1 nicotinate-nucleotide adenylyltransferase [Novimethylophilus kurashikiensis]